MILLFYNVILLVALVVGAPWWLWRLATMRKYREGLRERLGRVPRRLARGSATAGGRPLIWLHAVSVGEVLAVTRMVRTVDAELSDYSVVISTATRTGQALARERFDPDRVFYCPLDLPWAVRAYMNALRPSLLILAETEFWPNLLGACFRRKIPVAVINARISGRSWPRYRKLRLLWRPILERLGRVLAQSQTDADRLLALGCRPDRVAVAGNLKFDVRTAQESEAASILKSMAGGLRLVVAGSTLEGEESALLEAWPQLLAADSQLAMVLAPRHPERFSAVAALLDRSGIPWCKRSAWPPPAKTSRKTGSLRPGEIVLLDTIGELASVYALASVAFVGGSLVPAGGHNPLEPAQFAVPTVMGPHYANFVAITDSLRSHDALRIAAKEELAAVLIDLLGNRSAAKAMGARAKEVFDCQAGATDRCVAAIRELLGSAGQERVVSATPAARPLLWPLVPVYRLGLALREYELRSGLQKVSRLKWPVVSVGNLSAGGTGKTPLTIALARALAARGLRVDVLSRGYGRKSPFPARVDPNGAVDDFGDEPLVIAREAQVPVYVAAERYEAGLLAESDESEGASRPSGHKSPAGDPGREQAGVHLLDDGFQHRQLARDIDILLLSNRDLRDRLLPAGNLREPLRAADRAQVIAIPANEPEVEAELNSRGWQGTVWRLRRRTDVPHLDGPVAAFCGIARPEQFFEGLEQAGVKLAVRTVFPDHHRYKASDLDRVVDAARAAGAPALITTEKDRVRIGALAESLPPSLPLQTAQLRIEIEDQDTAVDGLMQRLAHR
ncbi:MAG: tetraacyldisaccharide 4'-kinase [Terracidiphilus sp.]